MNNYTSKENYDHVKNNIDKILENVNNACNKVGKSIDDITIIAVTKTVPCEIVNFALKNGINCIGENKVQEFISKYEYYDLENKKVHFIGHLQRNKVKYIIDKVDFIESVDSLDLLKEINKQSIKANKVMNVMLQINISEDENKYGIPERDIDLFLEKSRAFSNVSIKGFMCIPKNYNDLCDIKKDFNKMHKLYIDKTVKKVDNINIMFLSMGMSNDYIDAILSGANVIRIGSNLFGYRK